MLGEWIGEQNLWIALRYHLYQHLQKILPKKAYAKDTVVILIGDEEYWKGEPAGRVPIKRDYLAKLVQALNELDPAVIALDFDLRSEPSDREYAAETEKLARAVKVAAQQRSVVLPKTIWLDESEQYSLEPDVVDRFDLGPVRRGYIALPFEQLRIALTIPLKGGGSIDSLAEAIVRARNERALQSLPARSEALFAGYLSAEAFTQVPAGQILGTNTSKYKSEISHQIVIVGAAWHILGFDRGSLVDTYNTPAGKMSGVFIHANYVEALLDRRVYRPMAKPLAVAVEAVLLAVLAVLFAIKLHRAVKVLLLLVCVAFVVFISFFAFTAFGVFYDFFTPLFSVIAHYAYEVVKGWRRDASLYRQQHGVL